jgi:hypothetical protein
MVKKKKRTFAKDREQAFNPRTKRWVKLDTKTGKIVAHKKTEGKYKGVREAKPKRRSKK